MEFLLLIFCFTFLCYDICAGCISLYQEKYGFSLYLFANAGIQFTAILILLGVSPSGV